MNASTLFGAGPLVAAGIASVGFGARVLAMGRSRARERAAAAADQGWGLLGLGWLPRWAMLLLVGGHVLLLAAPDVLMRWGSTSKGLYAIECAGFLLGLTALAGVAGGLRRHLRGGGSVDRADIADAVFLSSLTLAVASGLYVAARYRWASLWAAATVAPYVRSLALGHPAPSLLAGIPSLARLHVVAGFAAAAALPASRLGAALARATWRVLDAAGAATQAVAVAIVGGLRPQRLRALIWPDDDLVDLARHTRGRAAALRRKAPAHRAPSGMPQPETTPQIFPAKLPVTDGPSAGDADAQDAPLSAEGGG